MQAVPSLIGSGTAIAAAATGLVFGQPAEADAPAATTSTTSTTTSSSTITTSPSTISTFASSAAFAFSRQNNKPRRQISYDRDLPTGAHCSDSEASRVDPIAEHPRSLSPAYPDSLPLQDDSSLPQTRGVLPPIPRYLRSSSTKALRRKLSLSKYRSSASNVAEGRNSSSSSGSWIKKLAIRPSSDEGSDSSTVTVNPPSNNRHSHSLSLPTLSIPRNKLVKRSPSVKTDQSTASHSRSHSYFPQLRRPATSHQRAATLDHIICTDVDLQGNLPHPSSPSFDHQQADRKNLIHRPVDRTCQKNPNGGAPGWISFFHSRRLAIGGAGMTNRLNEARPGGRVTGKRIALIGDEARKKVHLVKPRMISMASAPAVLTLRSDQAPTGASGSQLDEAEPAPEPEQESCESVPSKRPCSLPCPPLPTNEMSQSPDGMQRMGQGETADDASEAERLASIRSTRHVSAPIDGMQVSVDQTSNAPVLPTMHHRLVIQSLQVSQENVMGVRVPKPRLLAHRRSHSSPLFVFPRISTLHIDSPRISPFSSSPSSSSSSPTAAMMAAVATAQIGRPHQPSGSSISSGVMSQLGPSTRCDRSSTMSISGSDTRGYIFGDDDESDFKSDTMYDSLRTAASSCVRALETPLDSIYDDSPPGTAGNGKIKRMSVQEMLGRVWDEDDRISEEEDENDVTAIRANDDDEMALPMHPPTLTVPRLSPQSSHDNLSSTANDLGRLGAYDELDEDWGDGDVDFSPLSLPSKSSSLNSAGLGADLRLALADASGGELLGSGRKLEVHRESRGGRRLSSLFDWIETPALDKNDPDGPYPRSKSALGKQEVDARGGRTSLRKGPAPAHIRSQSVPITQDGEGNAKPSSAKYGTWGLGTRPVSEDWDEDFDFDCGGKSEGGGIDNLSKSPSFLVPESIRASQPSVKAHSGQIRELSLLVNDLKRLCRHGRAMDMLEGPSKDLWEEAEGVIALASPDEDDESAEEVTSKSTSSDSDEAETTVVYAGQLNSAFDNLSLEPAMSKTAVVRERHSPKRRSVFSPDDDIFGGANWPLADDGGSQQQPGRPSRPRTPCIQVEGTHDVAGATRSVMEAMSRSLPRHRSPGVRYDKKVHFDTNSLKVLVRRAGELRDSLSDLVRHAENLTQTPCKAPRHERHVTPSPAFTRVFDDPNASPQ